MNLFPFVARPSAICLKLALGQVRRRDPQRERDLADIGGMFAQRRNALTGQLGSRVSRRAGFAAARHGQSQASAMMNELAPAFLLVLPSLPLAFVLLQ